MIAEPTTAPSRAMTPASMAACSWASPRPASTAGRSARRAVRSSRTAASSRRPQRAQEARFRPCLRCRPEIAPDLAFWRGTANTVSRALALIADGALDGEDSDVETLAERLGVGGRQLRRLFQRHLGASPIAVAQTRRVLFAKQLLHDTHLPMAEVALASGFGSVRRFNETFHDLFGRPPSALRRKRRRRQFGARRRDAQARLPPALRLAGHAGGAIVARGARRRMGRRQHLASPHRSRRQAGSASRSPICRRAIR